MDASKQMGKMREQMNREIKVRLDSERKWNKIASPESNKFYSQSYLNKKISEKLSEREEKKRPSTPAVLTVDEGKGGESYFVSPKMFEAMDLCRCGRKKEGTHLIKCLQKSVIKYSDGHVSTGSSPLGDKLEESPNIPKTSNALCGYFNSKYSSLERSTFYITPRAYLKHKITDQVYNSIIIG